MKTVIVLFFLSIGYYVNAQEKLVNIFPVESGKVVYSSIVPVDSISKSVLFGNSKVWITNNYKSGKSVIENDDKENYDVIGKGFFQVAMKGVFGESYPCNIEHTFRIQCKDGKYKYSFYNISIENIAGKEKFTLEEYCNRKQIKQAVTLENDINSKILSIIESLESTMKSKSNSNW